MCGWWEWEDVCGGGYVNVSGGSVRTTVCGVKVCGEICEYAWWECEGVCVGYVNVSGESVRTTVCGTCEGVWCEICECAWWECEGVRCEGCEHSVSVSVRGVCGAELVSVVYSGTN